MAFEKEVRIPTTKRCTELRVEVAFMLPSCMAPPPALSRVGFSCRRFGSDRRTLVFHLFPRLALALFLFLLGFGLLRRRQGAGPRLWDEAAQGQRLSLQ